MVVSISFTGTNWNVKNSNRVQNWRHVKGSKVLTPYYVDCSDRRGRRVFADNNLQRANLYIIVKGSRVDLVECFTDNGSFYLSVK